MLTVNELQGIAGPHGGHHGGFHHGGGFRRGGGGWWGGYAPAYPVCVDQYNRVVPCPPAYPYVITAGLGGSGDVAPMMNQSAFARRGSNMLRTPTMCMPQAPNTVAAAQAQASGSLLSLNVRTPGMGDLSSFTSSVPLWAWTAGGGLLGGFLVGALVFRKKR